MADSIKSGREVLEEFFSELPKMQNIDKGIVDILAKLHKENRLTDTNLINELNRYKEEKLNDKN